MSNAYQRLQILEELLTLTKEMASKRNDADFLLSSVLRRQTLMDKYDKIKLNLAPLSSTESDQAFRIVQEIMSLDKIINATLEGHRNETMKEMTKNNNSQKVFRYQQLSSLSGNVLDMKK